MVQSITVIMVKCADCSHTWATDLDDLPDDIQVKVRALLQDDHGNAFVRHAPRSKTET
jgi:hypothetical protein